MTCRVSVGPTQERLRRILPPNSMKKKGAKSPIGHSEEEEEESSNNLDLKAKLTGSSEESFQPWRRIGTRCCRRRGPSAGAALAVRSIASRESREGFLTRTCHLFGSSPSARVSLSPHFTYCNLSALPC